MAVPSAGSAARPQSAPAWARSGDPARWAAVLAWIAVALEGYDLVVLGSTVSALLDYEPWGLTATEAAGLSTAGLVGVGVGALVVGTLTDVVGRRVSLIACVSSFSALTLLCAVAPGPTWFGVLRFLAGLGLGGCLPTALALAAEYAPAGRGAGAMTRLMTGYHVGAVATALLAIPVLPALGWRWMYALGAAPALVVVPLMVARLPESRAFLLARGRTDRAALLPAPDGGAAEVRDPAAAAPPGTRSGLAALFTRTHLPVSLCLWVASFMGLLLVYGLNTWLPKIMLDAGYALGASLSFLLVLNVGAVLGLVVAGRVADRRGNKQVAVLWFAASALALVVLSVKVPLAAVYVVVLTAGVFVFSAQVLVYAYVGRLYPPAARATALGWASGIGRAGAICGPLLTGFLIDAGTVVPWGFYAFAAAGAVAALAVAAVPQRRVAAAA